MTDNICKLKYTMDMFILKHPEQSKEKYTEIVEMYKEKVAAHNKKVCESKYPDSGFDLFAPYDYSEHAFGYTDNRISPITFRAPLGVKCAMVLVDSSAEYAASSATPVGYYLYPRSSIVKTPFRLSNSVGIMDSGYRGELMAVIDNINAANMDMKDCISQYLPPMTRMFQICSPSLEPFMVQIVDGEEKLGLTERGSGGFGSTGA